jgi:mercuric ion transport protein
MNEKIGVLGAIGTAFLSSACCIGPAVLGGLEIGTAVTAQKLAAYRPLFMAMTIVLLGLGFYVAYRNSKRSKCGVAGCEASRISRWGRLLLWIATAVVLALIAFPYYYGALRAAFDKPQRTAPAVAAPEKLATVAFKIKGMTCSGCAVSVRNELLETPGVTAAEVDLETARAKVQYNPAKVSATLLIEAVNKTGFRASPSGDSE